MFYSRRILVFISLNLKFVFFSAIAMAEIKTDRYTNGKLHLRVEVNEAGLPQGVTKKYDPKGTLIYEKYFENGIHQGMGRKYHTNGKLKVEIEYGI